MYLLDRNTIGNINNRKKDINVTVLLFVGCCFCMI